MTWGMVAMAGASYIGAQGTGNANVKAMAAESIAQNEAGIKANITNSVRTGYRVGLLNMQRGLQKKNAMQYGFDVTTAGAKALGSATANQAASGTIGASADAVVNDISMKLGESQAAQQNIFEIDAQNFDTNLTSLVQEAIDAIAQPYKAGIPSAGTIQKQALTAAVVNFAGNYMGSKMSLGLGDAPTTGNRVSASTRAAYGPIPSGYGNTFTV